MFLQEELILLESYLDEHDTCQTTVSAGSVGWQIDHSLRAAYGIIKAMKASDPSEYQWKFNLGRVFILGFGIIPRGRAKAPETVVTKEKVSKDTLLELFSKTRKSLEQDLPQLQKHSFFVHPFVGKLRLKAAKKFIKVHTRHHLKIIKDILDA